MVLTQLTSVIYSVMHHIFTFNGFEMLQQWIYTNVTILPLIPAIIIVGGIIIFTLTYVSWRKYRAEQEKNHRKKDKMID
ncbi:sporulation protein YpjB [Oceanobacillus sp. CAU 1775]